MNGVHDLGGMDGFGPVEVEADEPVFHHPWERLVFGLVVAMSAQRVTNTHAFRHAIERMDAAHYLSSPYYEHWLTAIATLLVEKGMTTGADLDARAKGVVPRSRPVNCGTLAVPAPSAAPRFAVGSTVMVRNFHPPGHTRCPRYVRGKRGVVVRVDPPFLLPDVAAHVTDACKVFTYSVRFEARELWGESAEAATAMYVDVWETYLEAP